MVSNASIFPIHYNIIMSGGTMTGWKNEAPIEKWSPLPFDAAASCNVCRCLAVVREQFVRNTSSMGHRQTVNRTNEGSSREYKFIYEFMTANHWLIYKKRVYSLRACVTATKSGERVKKREREDHAYA